MAGSMWLKIDGCEGEANDDGHQKEIDINSYSFNMEHPINFRGGGLSSGETTVSPLTVTKQIDKASPNLMKFCLSAKSLKEVLLTARKRGENPIDYIKIKLKNALVSGVHNAGTGDVHGAEQVSFAFEAVEIEYTPQGADGKPQGAVTLKWDVKKNKEG
jgi:type VI secretion system secreted protein Hcp